MKARSSLSLKTTARRRGNCANRPRRDAGSHLASARGSSGNAAPRPARVSALPRPGSAAIGLRDAAHYITQYNDAAVSVIQSLPTSELVRELRIVRRSLRKGDGPPGRPHRRYYECLTAVLTRELAARDSAPDDECRSDRGESDES